MRSPAFVWAAIVTLMSKIFPDLTWILRIQILIIFCVLLPRVNFCYDFVYGLCLLFFARSKSESILLLFVLFTLVIVSTILRPIFLVAVRLHVSSVPDLAPQAIIRCIHAVDNPLDYSFPPFFRCVDEILWINSVF